MRLSETIKALLTPPERKLFERLSTPAKVQDWLEALPPNFELHGDTYMSPRSVLKERKAHCMEGAVFAAAVFAYHGREPQLMDLQTADPDEDHVVALFKDNGYWGAVSKTNHSILRYRDAVYKTPRELALSYFHEYFLEENGKKTLRAFSKPFALSRYAPARWVTSEKSLEWLTDTLDWSRHFPIAPKKNLKALRRAVEIERNNLRATEWTRRGERRYK